VSAGIMALLVGILLSAAVAVAVAVLAAIASLIEVLPPRSAHGSDDADRDVLRGSAADGRLRPAVPKVSARSQTRA